MIRSIDVEEYDRERGREYKKSSSYSFYILDLYVDLILTCQYKSSNNTLSVKNNASNSMANFIRYANV